MKKLNFVTNLQHWTILIICMLVHPNVIAISGETNPSDGADYTGCGHGMGNTAGAFVPVGDINSLVGSQPFKLYCRLNTRHDFYTMRGLRSDSLFIEQKARAFPENSDAHGELTRRQNINEADEYITTILPSTILNETTIVAWYNPSNVTSDLLGCRLRRETEPSTSPYGICDKRINVGYYPSPPKNFSCISQNWENLKCTWVEPYNPIRTTYALTYRIRNSYPALLHCPPKEVPNNEQNSLESWQMSQFMGTARIGNCYLDHETKPYYRNVKKRFTFYMNVTNPLKPNGTYPDYVYPVKHYDIVRPNKPVMVTMIALSSTSIKVRFRTPHELDHFPPGLKYLIKYRSEYDAVDEWSSYDVEHLPPRKPPCHGRRCETNDGERYVFLEKLLPYAEYTVQIKLLSAQANASDERMWSDAAIQKGRTLASIPKMPPMTTIGSFEIVDISATERNIVAYWKRINRSDRNGPNFRYKIPEFYADGESTKHVHSKVTSSYASFPKLSSKSRYTIIVTSENNQGIATQDSRIVIPSNINNQLHKLSPRASTKLVYNDTLSEISWLAPLEANQVTSYTIFWCLDENGHDRPYQCEGQLNWKEVDVKHRSVNISLPTDQTYQFAVAANVADTMSSGMIWTSCTIIHNKVVGRLKPVVIEKVESDRMQVRWHLDCSDRVGVVTGYQISYCAIPSSDPSQPCNLNVDGNRNMVNLETTSEASEAWIKNLEPWTYYKVAVLVKTRAGSSELSSVSVGRTASSMPNESVRHLRGRLINRNSAKLTWNSPAKPNGELHSYEISIRYKSHKSMNMLNKPRRKKVDASKTEVQIDGLKFFSDYLFQVRPCVKRNKYQSTEIFDDQTICGTTWAALSIDTGIGESSIMEAPTVTFVNSTEVNVAWSSEGFDHGGPVIRYEVGLVSQSLKKRRMVEYNGTETSTIIFLDKDWSPNCENESLTTNLYNFSIRAVTKDQFGTLFYSPWSTEEVVPAYCYHAPPVVLIITLCIVASILVVLTFLCFYKCIQWVSNKLKVMEDVGKEMEKELHMPTRADGANKWRSPWNEMQTINGDISGTQNTFQSQSPSKMAGLRLSPKMADNNQLNDPMTENLLNGNLENAQKKIGPKRIISGSDTTSGCESGETESLEKDSSVANGNDELNDVYGDRTILVPTFTEQDKQSSVESYRSNFGQMLSRNTPSAMLPGQRLPLPPNIIESASNRAYVRSPEHNSHIYGERPDEQAQDMGQCTRGFSSTPVHLAPQFNNLELVNNETNFPSNGYTKAVLVDPIHVNQRAAMGSPTDLPFSDPHMTIREGDAHRLPYGYVTPGNAFTEAPPSFNAQLNHCNSLSSSTSGVSSNTPSISSQNNHQTVPSSSYVAFSAVCTDDMVATGTCSSPTTIVVAKPSVNCQNGSDRRTSPPLGTSIRGNLPRPPVVPIAKGYISVAQANFQPPNVPSGTRRPHQKGYSRVVMPQGESGPPSLSAAYTDGENIYNTNVGNNGKTFTALGRTGNPCLLNRSQVKNVDDVLYNSWPSARELGQDSRDYLSATVDCSDTEQGSPIKYMNSSHIARQAPAESSFMGGKIDALPSLVISPNDLLVKSRDSYNARIDDHDTYIDRTSEMQNVLSNHINVVATLDSERQSTMV